MRTSMVCASHSPLLYCYAKEPNDWDTMQAAFTKRASAVQAFNADLVIAFGADHFNGFSSN